MYTYNDASMNRMKAVKESLSDRYSSNQLINVLDDILDRGVEAVVRNSNFVDRVAASCLTWYSGNSRRKISQLPKHQVIGLLSLYIILSKPSEKMKVLRKLRLERNIKFFILEVFLEHAATYQKLEVQAAKLKFVDQQPLREEMWKLQKALGVSGSLSALYSQVKVWHDNAVRFRNQIMEQYIRHATMKAHAFYRTNPSRLSLPDLIQNFVLAIHKGVNKFDPSKGTLTSCIDWWLRNAQSQTAGFGHEYGIAYNVPASIKRGMARDNSSSPVNISVQIDSDEESVSQIVCNQPTPYEVSEKMSETMHIRRLAKLADPLGLARMSLGIEEVLLDDEIRLLRTAI